LCALLDHVAKIREARQAWKVMYPLREVFLLAVCAKIASDDDCDVIVDWRNADLALLSSLLTISNSPGVRSAPSLTETERAAFRYRYVGFVFQFEPVISSPAATINVGETSSMKSCVHI
jgi:hypothetical protein